jgi:paired amphipathic helix protein Sin3a
VQVLYSRLRLFKELAAEISSERSEPHKSNPLLDRLGILGDMSKLGERGTDAAHFYDLLLESCEKLFDNELEQTAFEDQLRYMFGIHVGSYTWRLNSSANNTVACVQDVHR